MGRVMAVERTAVERREAVVADEAEARAVGTPRAAMLILAVEGMMAMDVSLIIMLWTGVIYGSIMMLPLSSCCKVKVKCRDDDDHVFLLKLSGSLIALSPSDVRPL